MLLDNCFLFDQRHTPKPATVTKKKCWENRTLESNSKGKNQKEKDENKNHRRAKNVVVFFRVLFSIGVRVRTESQDAPVMDDWAAPGGPASPPGERRGWFKRGTGKGAEERGKRRIGRSGKGGEGYKEG